MRCAKKYLRELICLAIIIYALYTFFYKDVLYFPGLDGAVEVYIYDIGTMLMVISLFMVIFRHPSVAAALLSTGLVVCVPLKYRGLESSDNLILDVIFGIIIFVFLLAIFLRLTLPNLKRKDILISEPSAGDMVELSEGEVLLRRYIATAIDFRPRLKLNEKGTRKIKKKYCTTGCFFVTSRRLIYQVNNKSLPLIGSKSRGCLHQSVDIKDIKGYDYFVSNAAESKIWPLLMLVSSLIVLLVTIILMVIVLSGTDTDQWEHVFNSYFFSIPFTIFTLFKGCRWYMAVKKPETYMRFGARGGKNTYAVFVSEQSRGYTDSLAYLCRPTPEFETFVSEIGAITLDLQKYGDDAIDKWVVHYD